MSKVALVCNGSQPWNVFPTFIMGSAAAASGDDVLLFFTPGGAPVLVKGEIEKIEAKGLPNLLELYEGLVDLGGRVIACELALGAKDIKPEDFREGVEIMGVTSFLGEIQDAQITFAF
jgi:predicted peroxiredoxin